MSYKNITYDPNRGLWLSRYKYKYRTTEPTSKIEDEIQENAVLQVHKKVPKPDYLPFTAPENTYCADLMFLDNYAKYNSGYHILLNVIEVTSKYLYVYPLKSKTGVYDAFKDLLENKNVEIENLITDAGSEFINKKLKELLNDHGINLTNTTKKTYVGTVERVNKTIRELIERYLTLTGGYHYINILPELVKNYNTSYHSAIDATPEEFSVPGSIY